MGERRIIVEGSKMCGKTKNVFTPCIPKSSIEQKQYFLFGVCAQPLSNGPFLETEEDFWVGPMPLWSFCLLFH